MLVVVAAFFPSCLHVVFVCVGGRGVCVGGDQIHERHQTSVATSPPDHIIRGGKSGGGMGVASLQSIAI